ncbi:hypothetical protein HOO65_100059 [Ceratocystis lukuohia]|uniref:Uncharacterized protein n=1 Tax=Ceratocystis lukuohia TaxID=2019550 RepID=A0ABR4M8Q3_9PEZI
MNPSFFWGPAPAPPPPPHLHCRPGPPGSFMGPPAPSANAAFQCPHHMPRPERGRQGVHRTQVYVGINPSSCQHQQRQPGPQICNCNYCYNGEDRHTSISLTRPLFTDINPNFVAVPICDMEYLVLREVLHEHLPRISLLPRAATLNPRAALPDDLPSFLPLHLQPSGAVLLSHALGFLFCHLEQLSTDSGNGRHDGNGALVTITARLHHRLSQSPTTGRACSNMLSLVVALCLLLDENRGFGCSAALAGEVGAFMADLGAVLRRISRPEDHVMKGLVMAFARVFKGDSRSMGLLRRLWDYLEPSEKRDIVRLVEEQGRVSTTCDALTRFMQGLNEIQGACGRVDQG